MVGAHDESRARVTRYALCRGLIQATCAGLAVLALDLAVADARTIAVTDLGRLHLTSRRGSTLNEEGKALGTIPGPFYIHLHETTANHISAEVNIYPSDGSVTGYASAGYRASAKMGTFSGTMSIARGTGSWNAVHRSALKFSGTLALSNDTMTVKIAGTMYS